MTQSALRLGVMTLPHLPWPVMVEQWRRLEELGYDSAWNCDHFVHRDAPSLPWFEGWTQLAALAARTSRIRLGSLVTSITYRNPAIPAREALTVDHVSSGRLELAVGAGGSPLDATMTGVGVWEAPERMRRYREFVAITDALLRDRVTTYHGQYYRVQDAEMHPAPVQQPRPPLNASMDAFVDFVGRYREAGVNEGLYRDKEERLADNRMLERVARDAIPALRENAARVA
jgi:alkanesulfonate monooxygenase SsuD/methylene tetrahydromethanopterin reductase-like flavin-dependent oxidoreductase (luciferase family)